MNLILHYKNTSNNTYLFVDHEFHYHLWHYDDIGVSYDTSHPNTPWDDVFVARCDDFSFFKAQMASFCKKSPSFLSVHAVPYAKEGFNHHLIQRTQNTLIISSSIFTLQNGEFVYIPRNIDCLIDDLDDFRTYASTFHVALTVANSSNPPEDISTWSSFFDTLTLSSDYTP